MKNFTLIAILLLLFSATCLNAESELPSILTKDDIVVEVKLDSKKPAKTEIFRCTVTEVIQGTETNEHVTISFLHFPECPRLEVGKSYIAIVRNGQFVRSDMLSEFKDKEPLFTCAWEIGTEDAKMIIQRFGK